LTTNPGNNAQIVALQPNTDYQLSVWVNAGGMTSGGIRFDTNDKFDDPTGPYGPGGTCQFNINLGDALVWTRYTGTFNSSTETSVTVRTYQNSMVGTVYFDNVVLVAVNASNVAPVITSVPVTNATQDTAYSYTLLAADPGNSPLIRTALSIPSWCSFDTNSGVLNGTPTGADAGSHPISLSVSDGLLSVTQNFTIAVAPIVSFGYDVWAANKGVGAANADHDNDGRNNFCEYALDGNPTNDQDIGVSPILLRAGDGFEYIHLQRNDDTNLVYIVEACTDLFSGVWTKDGISVLGTNAYSVKYDEVIYGVSATNQYSFIRLGIEGR
jgi:hypothetical protein